MPPRKTRAPYKARKFEQAYVATGDIAIASKLAGYAHVQTGHGTLARPAVQAEVFRLQMERLTNEAMPLAIDTLIACMRAKDAPYAAKNQASKIVLDHTAGREGAAGDKQVHELSMEEINARIAVLEARKVERAAPVEVDVTYSEPPAASVFE